MPYVHDGDAILKDGELIYDDIDSRSGPLLVRALNHNDYLESKIEALQDKIKQMEEANSWKPCTPENPPPVDVSLVLWYPEKQLRNGMCIPAGIVWFDRIYDLETVGAPGVTYTNYKLMGIPPDVRGIELSAPWKEDAA